MSVCIHAVLPDLFPVCTISNIRNLRKMQTKSFASGTIEGIFLEGAHHFFFKKASEHGLFFSVKVQRSVSIFLLKCNFHCKRPHPIIGQKYAG